MLNKSSYLAIIILNWNGWKDTLECLTSLTQSSYQNFKIILIDNGSTDDSLQKIRAWAKGEIATSVGPFYKNINRKHVNLFEDNLSKISDKNNLNNGLDIILIKNDTNWGFAKGNNIGISYALQQNFDNILLLNNDTTVDSDCLTQLSEFLDSNKKYDIVTPKICYYEHPDIIWNCGGKLTFTGSRKYYYYNKKNNDSCKNRIKEITFITGCALLVRSDIFKKYGLFTEKFFHGEEDYDFSLRIKKNRIKMAALCSAKVYHKVGASEKIVFKKDILAKVFIFYLNRFINLKSYYSIIYWKVWRLASLAYIIPMLKIKYSVRLKNLIKFSFKLLKYSSTYKSVSKDDFFKVREILGKDILTW